LWRRWIPHERSGAGNGEAIGYKCCFFDLATFYRATADLFFVLKMAHDGVSVESAVELSGLSAEMIENFLETASEIGLLILPS